MKVKKTALHNMVLVFLLIVVLSPGCSARVSPTSQPKTAVISTVPTTTLKGKTIIVTSPADSGPDTLRHALLFAHNGDTITFDPAFFPPNVPVTIALSSGLTPITQGNLTIDASNAGVILDGANITDPSTDGLSVSSNGNTIRGLQIVNFPGHGVALQDGAQNNTIGGDQKVGIGLLGQGNLVSGNKADGIGISDGSRNTIMGNYIGTDISGTIAWGNGAGIDMNGTNYNNLIGNLISGNKSYGIQLFKNSTHNTITGNLVGTDR
jgi:parallel beta-helix repeat protein